MRTVQEIFDESIHLIDAQHESSGSTDTPDTREYRVRAAKLLSSLLNEAYPYSDTYNASDYEDSVDYSAGQCVNYGSGRYLCIADVPAGGMLSPPMDTEHWQRVGSAAGRPTHPPVLALTDAVYMDDMICLSALPAGLAALLVFDEDLNKYNAFWGDYQSRLAQARATLPASGGFEDVENPYSEDGLGAGIEYGEFSRW